MPTVVLIRSTPTWNTSKSPSRDTSTFRGCRPEASVRLAYGQTLSSPRIFDADPRISKGVQFRAEGKFVAYPIAENGVDNGIQPIEGAPGHQITHFNAGRILSFHWPPDGKRLGILRAVSWLRDR